MPLRCATMNAGKDDEYVFCTGTKAKKPKPKKSSTAIVPVKAKKKEKVDRTKIPEVVVEHSDLKTKSVGALTKLRDKLTALVNSKTYSGEVENAKRKLALVKKAILEKGREARAKKKK